MPVVNHAQKEVQLKIVFYGPGLGGKTTNLQYLHTASRPELRGKLLSLATESERTIFFDLLPVSLGTFKGYSIRLHLCTVPGQIAYDHTRKLILRHVDGIVFVVDSQPEALGNNIDSIRNLETNLLMQGDDPARIPLAVQYNKRDLKNILSIEELRDALKIPEGVPEIEACAREGVGVAETLKAVVKACLNLVKHPQHLPEGRSPSILPGRRASMFPDGQPAALRPGNAPSESIAVEIPKAPKLPDFGSALGPSRRTRQVRLNSEIQAAPLWLEARGARTKIA